MPLKCESCGHVHLDDAPALRETYALLEEEKVLGTHDVAEAFDLTLQGANRRLSRLHDLGLCEKMPVKGPGHYKMYLTEPNAPSHG